MDHSSSCAFALVTSPRVDVRCVLVLYTCLYCYGSVTTWRRWLMRGVRQQRRRRHFAVHSLGSTRYAARMPTRITAVIVYKGGVAKTTTVVNPAAAFVAHGQRVLIIDIGDVSINDQLVLIYDVYLLIDMIDGMLSVFSQCSKSVESVRLIN